MSFTPPDHVRNAYAHDMGHGQGSTAAGQWAAPVSSEEAATSVAVDVTDTTFQSAVYDRSFEVPVVLDLGAAWSGPSQQLALALDRIVRETAGAVDLAKVDVDTSPRVGAMFGVQSVPAVFAIVEGVVVDQFLGALPEATVQDFVDRLRV